MDKQKILIVFGTRPEAIKMAPVVKEFKEYPELFDTKVCVTAQHREMLDQVLDFFEVEPDYDLDLMTQEQSLHSLTAKVIQELKPVLNEFDPDVVYVQGDTTTSFAATLATFYENIKVYHVEAGLRTYDKKAPFPEELNRQLTSRIADIHFAPTDQARKNLLSEGIGDSSIIVTGNTVIDALQYTAEKVESISSDEIKKLESLIDSSKKLILVTGHRRENFGVGFQDICDALKELAQYESVQIIYPVHLNPNVRKPVYDLLGDIENIKLMDPLSYETFVWLMKRSYLVLTDSGGIQEEAPGLSKPVLVMRETTERTEAVEAGTVLLVGTDKNKIVTECVSLIQDPVKYEKMSVAINPYGDGKAAKRIVEFQKNKR